MVYVEATFQVADKRTGGVIVLQKGDDLDELWNGLIQSKEIGRELLDLKVPLLGHKIDPGLFFFGT